MSDARDCWNEAREKVLAAHRDEYEQRYLEARARRGMGPPDRSGKPPNTGRTDIDHDEVVRRYQAGETLTQLAEAFRCSHTLIAHILKRRGVPRRPKGGNQAAARALR